MKELVILPDEYRKRSTLFVLAFAGVLVLLFFGSGVSGWNAVAALGFTAFVSLCGLLSFETRISQDQKKIVRVWYLAGLLPLWRKSYPFIDLRGVQQRVYADAQQDIWQIGLVTAAEKFLMVMYFTTKALSQTCPEAERFRDYLARLVGVPVLEQEQAA